MPAFPSLCSTVRSRASCSSWSYPHTRMSSMWQTVPSSSSMTSANMHWKCSGAEAIRKGRQLNCPKGVMNGVYLAYSPVSRIFPECIQFAEPFCSSKPFKSLFYWWWNVFLKAHIHIPAGQVHTQAHRLPVLHRHCHLAWLTIQLDARRSWWCPGFPCAGALLWLSLPTVEKSS